MSIHTHDTVHMCQMEVRKQLWESILLVQRVGFKLFGLGARNCWVILPSLLSYFYLTPSKIITSFFNMCFPSYPSRLFVCLFIWDRLSCIPDWSSTYYIVDDGLEFLLLPRPPKSSDYKHGQFFELPSLWGLNCQINWIQMWQCTPKPQTLIHEYTVLLMLLIQGINYYTFLVRVKWNKVSVLRICSFQKLF